jgi:redox-sensitive bicupin YhaK (pirin superfamily)
MLSIRSAQDRGHAQQAWLDSYHSFSFADYYDPKFNSFRDLRVLNEDRIAPAKGFAPHPHRDMEILTYVLEGSLEHRDSLGNGGVLTAGEVQHISAGRGISHSEFNHSETELLHLLQIWLLPNKNGVDPDYAQKRYRIAEEPDRLHLAASPDGREGSLTMKSDAQMYIARLNPKAAIDYVFTHESFGWLQVARGRVIANQLNLQQGDALAISLEERLTVVATEEAEILLFDLP